MGISNKLSSERLTEIILKDKQIDELKKKVEELISLI